MNKTTLLLLLSLNAYAAEKEMDKKLVAQLHSLRPSPSTENLIQTVEPVIAAHNQAKVQYTATPHDATLEQQFEAEQEKMHKKILEVGKKISEKQRVYLEVLHNKSDGFFNELFQLQKDENTLSVALSAAQKEYLSK